MSQDGILRDDRFDKIAIDASQGETIGESYERMKAALHAAANSTPPSGGETAPASQHQFKFERALHFHAPGQAGRPSLMLRADSEADLQKLENQILYGHD